MRNAKCIPTSRTVPGILPITYKHTNTFVRRTHHINLFWGENVRAVSQLQIFRAIARTAHPSGAAAYRN